MIERKADRRSGASHFTGPAADQRRPAYERRGTVPAAAALTRGQQLFGERRQNKR
jgi:hypothetical protein